MAAAGGLSKNNKSPLHHHKVGGDLMRKMTHTTTMAIFLNGCGSHFVFNRFIPKVNQIIRNTVPRVKNLNAIQATVHKFSCPQAF